MYHVLTNATGATAWHAHMLFPLLSSENRAVHFRPIAKVPITDRATQSLPLGLAKNIFFMTRVARNSMCETAGTLRNQAIREGGSCQSIDCFSLKRMKTARGFCRV